MKMLFCIDIRMMDRLNTYFQNPAYLPLYRRQCDFMTQFYLSLGE